jgi:hypothetical protein
MGGNLSYVTDKRSITFKRFAAAHFLKLKIIIGRDFNFAGFFGPFFFKC